MGTPARRQMQHVGDVEEATPLLTSSNYGKETKKERSLKRHVLEYIGMIHCLVVAGIVAWAVSKKVQGVDAGRRPEEIVEWKSQLMGYASAMLYGKPFSHTLRLVMVLMVSPEWGHVYPKYVSDWYSRRRRDRLKHDQ